MQHKQTKLEKERQELTERKNSYIALSIFGLILTCTLLFAFVGIPMFIIGLIKIMPLSKEIGEIDTKLNRTTINNFLR